jgi:hypothetical protein
LEFGIATYAKASVAKEELGENKFL